MACLFFLCLLLSVFLDPWFSALSVILFFDFISAPVRSTQAETALVCCWWLPCITGLKRAWNPSMDQIWQALTITTMKHTRSPSAQHTMRRATQWVHASSSAILMPTDCSNAPSNVLKMAGPCQGYPYGGRLVTAPFLTSPLIHCLDIFVRGVQALHFSHLNEIQVLESKFKLDWIFWQCG